MSQNITGDRSCDQLPAVSPDSEVMQELVFGTIEFRSSSLKAIITELSAAVESGAFDHLQESFVVRIRGGEFSPTYHRWYCSKP